MKIKNDRVLELYEIYLIHNRNHLREMAKTSPYLFAHGIYIGLKKALSSIHEVIIFAISLLKKRDDYNPEQLDTTKEPFVPYYSDSNNMKKASNIAVEKTTEGVVKFVDSSIAAYEKYFSKEIPIEDKKEIIRKQSIIDLKNELNIK